MPTTVEEMEKKGDFVLLANNKEYEEYFGMLKRAFEAIKAWYKQIKGANVEERIIGEYIDRIMCTLRLIALKCAYAERPMLRLDLNDSGYPHAIAFQGVEVDLLERDQTLLDLETQPRLKDAMLTHLATREEEPTRLRESISLRQYFEQLNLEEIILPFTAGKLELVGENEARRHYFYSWLVFDSSSSVPHIYVLAFEQDANETSLEISEVARNQLFDACKKAGSNVSHLQSIATAIDDQIESIHPKILRRIKLGPILSVEHARCGHPLVEYLRNHGKPFDFLFHVRTEIVFSKRQVGKARGFFGSREVREVFDVPQHDLACARAGVSTIRRLLLMPHHVAQHLDPNDENLREYNIMATYTKGGEVHAI